MKRLIYVVFIIHAMLILLVYWGDISNPGEDWSWMAAFFLDFPVSIGIHQVLHLAEQSLFQGNDARGLLILHAVLGGVWWIGIALGIRKIFWRK